MRHVTASAVALVALLAGSLGPMAAAHAVDAYGYTFNTSVTCDSGYHSAAVAVQVLPQAYPNQRPNQQMRFRLWVREGNGAWDSTNWFQHAGSFQRVVRVDPQQGTTLSVVAEYGVLTTQGWDNFREFAAHTQMYNGGFRQERYRSCVV
jgi:hypothetical protein